MPLGCMGDHMQPHTDACMTAPHVDLHIQTHHAMLSPSWNAQPIMECSAQIWLGRLATKLQGRIAAALLLAYHHSIAYANSSALAFSFAAHHYCTPAGGSEA